MRNLTFLVCSIFCTLLHAQTIGIESFANGFSDPVNITNAGGTDTRLFVVEQAGRIRIINANGSVNTASFLDINDRVINGGGERGLLGLAFHPNYASNGFFYVHYNNNSGNTIISRFSRSIGNPNLADDTSELILLTVAQPFSNHNGGQIAFGADGFLYIALGDGGSGGDPGDRSQNITLLLGKLLRIDVDNPSNGNNYGIPPTGNYFVSNPSAAPEIFSVGLRNPYRFSFDRLNNDIWIADVGQENIEEINRVNPNTSNINYGWRCYEGNSAYNLSGNCPPQNTLTFPVAQYLHNGDGNFKCSITGGYRYRGTTQTTLVGLYFFADFCSDEIGTLEQNGPTWTRTFSQRFVGNGWSSFGEDVNGELYICGLSSGTVYRIVDVNLGIDEESAFQVNMYPNPANDEFTIDATESNIMIEAINVFSVHGSLITSQSSIYSRTATISTNTLASGMYLVEVISTRGNKEIQKLIKN